MAAPWHPLLDGQQDVDDRIGAFLPLDTGDLIDVAPWGQPFTKPLRIGDRRRQRGTLHIGCDCLQPGHGQRQQIAALAGGEGVDRIDDDPFQPSEQFETVRIRQQERQAFGRRQ